MKWKKDKMIWYERRNEKKKIGIREHIRASFLHI